VGIIIEPMAATAASTSRDAPVNALAPPLRPSLEQCGRRQHWNRNHPLRDADVSEATHVMKNGPPTMVSETSLLKPMGI
jgi:hypothetical protein